MGREGGCGTGRARRAPSEPERARRRARWRSGLRAALAGQWSRSPESGARGRPFGSDAARGATRRVRASGSDAPRSPQAPPVTTSQTRPAHRMQSIPVIPKFAVESAPSRGEIHTRNASGCCSSPEMDAVSGLRRSAFFNNKQIKPACESIKIKD